MIQKKFRFKCIRMVIIQFLALFKGHIVMGAVIIIMVEHGYLLAEGIFQTVCKSGFS